MTKLLTIILFSAGSLSVFAMSTHWLGADFHTQDGTPLVAGARTSFAIPAGCSRVTGYEIYIDQPGTVSIDVWKTAYPNVPTSANSITGGASPTITSGQHTYTTSLTRWKTAVLPHDVFTFYLTYITGGATQANVVLVCQ